MFSICCLNPESPSFREREYVNHSLLSEKGELFSTPSRKSAMGLLRTFKMFIWELDPKAALGSKRGRRKPKGFGS